MRLAYHYRNNSATTPDGAARHHQMLDLLSRLRTEGRVADYVAQDVETAFPAKEAEQQFLDRLRDFAGRHKVGLRRIFGSNKYGFCYVPPEFLLVYEGDDLREVFPCEIGEALVSPLEYLEEIAAGRPWTKRSVRGGEGKQHAALVAQICASPALLEPGLRLQGQSVQVSRDFG